MSSNVFDDVRRLVSARAAAEYYGFQPNRANFITCPFHNEKTASLKLFPDGGWKCFGCGKGGSVIDCVAALYDLSPLEAVRRLNEDFRLALPLDKPLDEETVKEVRHRREISDTYQIYEKWRITTLKKLTTVFRMAHLALKDCPSFDALTEKESLAVKWQAVVEHWADCLLCGDMSAQMDIFRDRKGVNTLCSKILSNSLMKSDVA